MCFLQHSKDIAVHQVRDCSHCAVSIVVHVRLRHVLAIRSASTYHEGAAVQIFLPVLCMSFLYYLSRSLVPLHGMQHNQEHSWLFKMEDLSQRSGRDGSFRSLETVFPLQAIFP